MRKAAVAARSTRSRLRVRGAGIRGNQTRPYSLAEAAAEGAYGILAGTLQGSFAPLKYLVRAADVTPYSPADHTGTRNFRLIGPDTVGAKQVEVLIGEVAKGK